MRWFHFCFYAFGLGIAVFLLDRVMGGITGGLKTGMRRKAGL